MSHDTNEQIDALHRRIDEIEEDRKESEPSLLRAIRTLVIDVEEFQEGRRKEFPKAAVLGVLFSYMRPRLIVAIAGLAAVLFSGAQVWLLLNQNRLMKSQNDFIDEQYTLIDLQARASLAEAFTTLVTSAGTPAELESVAVQLASFGPEGVELLANQIQHDTAYADVALRALEIRFPWTEEDPEGLMPYGRLMVVKRLLLAALEINELSRLMNSQAQNGAGDAEIATLESAVLERIDELEFSLKFVNKTLSYIHRNVRSGEVDLSADAEENLTHTIRDLLAHAGMFLAEAENVPTSPTRERLMEWKGPVRTTKDLVRTIAQICNVENESFANVLSPENDRLMTVISISVEEFDALCPARWTESSTNPSP